MLYLDVVESVFYNDLFVLDCDRRKWFPLRVHDKGIKKASKSNNDAVASGTDENNIKSSDTEKNGGFVKDGDSKNEASHEVDGASGDNESVSSDNSDLALEEDGDDNEQEPNRVEGWDLQMLRSNMFAFIDGEGNIVYERIDGSENGEEEGIAEPEERKEEEEEEEEKEETKADEEEDEEKEEEKDDNSEAGPAQTAAKTPSEHFNGSSTASKSNDSINNRNDSSRKITKSSVMKVNKETNTPEAVVGTEPLPRINASLLIRGHTLYILGGILEVGDREVTLDDMWSLDLKKRNKWNCLWPGSMHRQVWRGAIHDDDDSYISTGNENDSSDEEEGGDYDGAEVGEFGQESTEKSRLKGATKRSGIKQEMAELNDRYDLGNDQRVPLSGEALASFYARTSEYWNAEAAKNLGGTDAELSNKEIKREGFQLARIRYDELLPILARLAELEDLQKQASSSKEDRRESTNDKKKMKKSKRGNSTK